MNLHTSTPIQVLAFTLFLLIFNTSCSKDSDLFSEYVLKNGDEEIESTLDGTEGEQSEDTENTNDTGNTQDGTEENSDVDISADAPLGELKAFPGAEGFGKYTSGGRGGRVIEVTNLNSSGPGSFRDALETSGARIIVFRVGGYINLKSSLTIRNGNVTIAGQTAPGDGITLRRDGTFSSGLLNISADNVILRSIKIRTGPSAPECCGDNLRIASASNVVVDHCSLSWSIDESLSISNSTNITISNSIISESLQNATHIEGAHSKASLVTNHATRVTFYNNLFAHNVDRNPLIGGGSPDGPGTEFELVNNVIYNWSTFGMVFRGSEMRPNLINNVAIMGNQTSTSRYSYAISSTVIAYARGNFNKFRTSQSDDDWDAIGCFRTCGTFMSEPAPKSRQSTTPFDYPLKDQPSMSRNEIINNVLNTVGDFNEDLIDSRIKTDVVNGTGNIIDNPSQVGGYLSLSGGPTYPDVDKDGMDDNWEIENGLNPNMADDRNQASKGGTYTYLEVFLHGLTMR